MTEAGIYRKKPVSVSAIQWDGTDETSRRITKWVERTHNAGAIIDTDHIQHLWDFTVGAYVVPSGKVIFAPYKTRCLIIATLEGEMVCRPNWWVIRGVKGEFYPCDPEVFEETYEPKVA